MKYNQGFVPMAIVVIIIAILAVGGIAYYIGKSGSPLPTGSTDTTTAQVCDKDTTARIGIINSFSADWKSFQTNIADRPVLGSTGQAWGTPNNYQFIGNNTMLIAFEDGHVSLSAAVRFDCADDIAKNFTLIDGSVQDFPFLDQTAWTTARVTYGDPSRSVNTYTMSLFKGGQMVNYTTWTEIPENTFVWAPKGY